MAKITFTLLTSLFSLPVAFFNFCFVIHLHVVDLSFIHYFIHAFTFFAQITCCFGACTGMSCFRMDFLVFLNGENILFYSLAWFACNSDTVRISGCLEIFFLCFICMYIVCCNSS